MSGVLAIIPAREHSKGIPKKNVTPLAGRSPMNRAIDVCHACIKLGVMQDFYVTSDIDWGGNERWFGQDPAYQIGHWLLRPPALATDESPMIDVVKHALAQIPGPPEQIILLLQPTQPLRQSKHLKAAIAMIEAGADAVISVTPTESPDKLVVITAAGEVRPWDGSRVIERRQDARPAYRRDGTVYAFRRSHGYAYYPAAPLIIDPSETCALDTPSDWADAERRLQA